MNNLTDVREVEKKRKAQGKEIFSHPEEVTGSMYFGNIFGVNFQAKQEPTLRKKLK